MQPVLLVISILLLGVIVGLFLLWFIHLNLLVHRIRRRHPRYYAKIGRPYTRYLGIPVRDDGHAPKRSIAWWQCLALVYKGAPRSFLNDTTCQRLAKRSHRALRGFVSCALVGLFLILPVDGFALVLNRQPVVDTSGITALNAQTEGKLHVTAGNTAGTTPDTQTTTTVLTNSDVNTTKRKTTTVTQPAQTPVAPTLVQTNPTPTPSQPPDLTRADLTTALGSIASPGQQHARKIDVCQQLTTNSPVANDLGPAGGICTDSNLSNYNTY